MFFIFPFFFFISFNVFFNICNLVFICFSDFVCMYVSNSSFIFSIFLFYQFQLLNICKSNFHSVCVCVCVCAYSSPPCCRRRAGAYINAHDTFLFKRAIFEKILRQVILRAKLLQRFSVRANNV